VRIAAGGNAIAAAERGRTASCHSNILLLANFLHKTKTLLDGKRVTRLPKDPLKKKKNAGTNLLVACANLPLHLNQQRAANPVKKFQAYSKLGKFSEEQTLSTMHST
jgi:hypothetical protein